MALTTHIFWDWNGTLLDDTQAALDALNELLTRRNLPRISMAFYRATFAFPVRPFYTKIGLTVEDANWDDLAREYHEIYAAQPKKLNEQTLSALEYVAAHGARQSIISALRQDLLETHAAHFGVVRFMRHIYGVDNLDGGSKLDRARELLTRVEAEGTGCSQIVLIGDALHDFEVAQALGIRCVLCAQGGHAFSRLSAVAPTGATLMDAVKLAL